MPQKGPRKHRPAPERIAKSLAPFLVEVKEAFFKMHRSKRGPLNFGKEGITRFADPGKKYGVLYGGLTYFGAFSETIGQAIAPEELSSNILDQLLSVTEAQLKEYELSILKPLRSLQLVDLQGPLLRHFGADARLIMGDDYAQSQVFSKAIHEHPDKVDGIRYRARSDPEQISFAIFDRCSDVVRVEKSIGSLVAEENSEILAAILEHYKIALVRT